MGLELRSSEACLLQSIGFSLNGGIFSRFYRIMRKLNKKSGSKKITPTGIWPQAPLTFQPCMLPLSYFPIPPMHGWKVRGAWCASSLLILVKLKQPKFWQQVYRMPPGNPTPRPPNPPPPDPPCPSEPTPPHTVVCHQLMTGIMCMNVLLEQSVTRRMIEIFFHIFP